MQIIAFRVDSSLVMGTGHIQRSLVIARELQTRSIDVVFICAILDGNIASEVSRAGFDVRFLQAPRVENEVASAEKLWDKESQRADALQTVKIAKDIGCSTVVVDHYGLDTSWEGAVIENALRVVAINDLSVNTHCANVVINPSGTDSSKSLTPASKEINYFSGLRFSPIDARYSNISKPYPQPRSAGLNVLVFLGGADAANVTEKVIASLTGFPEQNLQLSVVLGKANLNSEELRTKFFRDSRVTFHNDLSDLLSVLMEVDFAVGAGGVAAIERFAAGVPSILIAVSANQLENCRKLENLGGAQFIGNIEAVDWKEFPSLVAKYSGGLGSAFMKIQETRRLVDGRGVKRICELVSPSLVECLNIRRAVETDRYIYFDWVNDESVRQNSLQNRPVTLKEHASWFVDKLANNCSRLFIFELRTLPIGQVRFEFDGTRWNLSYSIDQIIRGRGWAAKFIQMACWELLTEMPGSEIRAEVLANNVSSWKALMSSGFIERVDGSSQTIRQFFLAQGSESPR